MTTSTLSEFHIAKLQKKLHKTNFLTIFSSKSICISIFFYLCTQHMLLINTIMKNFLFTIGLMIIMIGCNNPLNKPISEDLSIKEITSVSKKDPGFLNFYNNYFDNKCYEYFLTDKTLRVLYSDITYKMFYNYVQQINDEQFINSVYNEAENEWNIPYGDSEKFFDSIMNYWWNHVAENSLDTYIDIEFDHAKSYSNLYGNGIRLYFKITPNKGKLHGIRFGYIIKSKEDDTRVLLNSTISYYTEFSQPIVISGDEKVYSNNAFFNDLSKNKLSNEDIKNKYSFEYDINMVKTQDDMLLSDVAVFNGVPNEIEQYMKTSSQKTKDDILIKYYGDGYTSLDTYKNLCLISKMKEKDQMCYNFLEYIINCKNAF